MATEKLLQGAAVALLDAQGRPIQRVLIGSTWTNTAIDIDMCALLLQGGASGYTVPTGQHFLYRRRRTTPDRSAFLTYEANGPTDSPDRAQILLDFGAMPEEVSRVTIAMTALTPNALVEQAGTLRTRLMDLGTGETRYIFQHGNRAQLEAACVTLWTLDRTGGRWTAKVTGTRYPGGPAALVRNHGASTS